MATGTINLNKSASSGNYIIGKIVWDATADEDLNESNVTCRIYVRKDNDGLLLTVPTSGTWVYSLTINGKAFTGSVSKDVLLDWVLLATESVSGITHDDDGTKSITIKGSVTGPTGTTLSGHKTSGSGTATMDTVPRASIINAVSCASKYFNGKLTYKYTPQSASFYNRCNISLNLDGEYLAVKSINLGKKTAAQQTAYVTLTEEEQAIIYNALPNTDKGTLRFTFRTYSDSGYSTQVGDPTYKEISLYVPKIASTLPDPGATLAPVHSLGTAFDGLYVQGISKVKATFSGKGKYGAKVKSYSMKVEGDSYGSSQSYTSGYLTEYGNVTVQVTATDSRGYSNTVNMSIFVMAYSKPKVVSASGEKEIICARCDSSGNLNDAGTYLKVKAKRSYSKCQDASGVQHNFCGIRVRYKQENGSYSSWKTLLAATTLTTEEANSSALYDGALLATSTYIAQVDVVDTIGNHTSVTFTIPTDKVYEHRSGARRSYTFGGYVEDDNTFAFAEDISVEVRGQMTIGGNAAEAVRSKSVDGNSGSIRFASGLTMQWGQVIVTPTAANTPAAAAVTFAIKYKGVPFVVTNPSSTVPGTSVLGCCAANVTAEGFDAILTRTSTTSTGVRWIAIGLCDG